MDREKIIIMGAAGRDFHNFNVHFRDNPKYQVVCFTATQIPNIEGRLYPASLAGELYPEGIPIYPESELIKLIDENDADEVVFAYSDVSHEFVMHQASKVIAAGADFRLMGLKSTQLVSSKPVISICAARTGSGKSQTSRYVARILAENGYRVAALRHPMPYGDLESQSDQRFATLEDLDKHNCTIEEREEYEPHIMQGVIVYAGVDYARILSQAEAEADIILWDGGNNDFSFLRSDLKIVVVDPHRPGHELRYHPGEANVRSADIILINKVNTAEKSAVDEVRSNVQRMNPIATIVEGSSPFMCDEPDQIKDKRVLVIEDGPTLTHGEMAYGAGWLAAEKYQAKEIIDPRPFATGSIQAVYENYPSTGDVLPAMGYGDEQIAELEETIRDSNAELVIVGTPIDLGRILDIDKPTVRVRYELADLNSPTLREMIESKFQLK